MNDVSVRLEEQAGVAMLNILIPLAGLSALVAKEYAGAPFSNLFDTVGAEMGVDPDLLRGIARRESNFDPAALSPPNTNGTRDYGLMQINSVTARAYGYPDPRVLVTSRINPDLTVVRRSIVFAARLLKDVRRELGDKANYWTTIAAYNAGSPAIRTRGVFNKDYVASVAFHHQFYGLAGLFRTGKVSA